MMDGVKIKSYPPPPIDRREILRYAGAKSATGEFDGVLDECIAELADKCVFRVCYATFPISHGENELDLTFMKSNSRDLSRALRGCESVLLFAATVGLEIDRLILRYGKISPVKSLFFQAIGAERIESLCNLLFTDLKEEKEKEGKLLRPRFSPGYGDFSLEAQSEIFAALGCARTLGLTLNQSLLMSPTKSVTALCGVASKMENV